MRTWEDRENYAEAHPIRAGAKGISGGAVLVVLVIVIAIVIGTVLWFAGVFTSDAKGRGDATKQINSGTNRIEQYNHFFDLDATIRTQATNEVAAVKALAVYNKQYPPSSNESFSVTEQRNNLSANVTGLSQLCTANVSQYNADSQKYTEAKFKSDKLPWDYNPGVCDVSVSLPAAPPDPGN